MKVGGKEIFTDLEPKRIRSLRSCKASLNFIGSTARTRTHHDNSGIVLEDTSLTRNGRPLRAKELGVPGIQGYEEHKPQQKIGEHPFSVRSQGQDQWLVGFTYLYNPVYYP